MGWYIGATQDGKLTTTRFDLKVLRTSARKDGWAAGNASLPHVLYMAGLLGWREVKARRTDPPITNLRPVDQQQANPRSLSATYGRGAQPLHTDGAYLPNPPDVVVLIAEKPNDTPTLLWNSRSPSPRTQPWQAISHGVFLINNGRDSFYATAQPSALALRYDPGCMIPCDQRARVAAEFFASAQDEAFAHHWTTRDGVLVIDNTVTLHARAEAAEDDTRVLKRIMFDTSESH